MSQQGSSSDVTRRYQNETFTFERVAVKPEVDHIPNLRPRTVELHIEIARKVQAKRTEAVATAPENRASPSLLQVSELRSLYGQERELGAS